MVIVDSLTFIRSYGQGILTQRKTLFDIFTSLIEEAQKMDLQLSSLKFIWLLKWLPMEYLKKEYVGRSLGFPLPNRTLQHISQTTIWALTIRETSASPPINGNIKYCWIEGTCQCPYCTGIIYREISFSTALYIFTFQSAFKLLYCTGRIVRELGDDDLAICVASSISIG